MRVGNLEDLLIDKKELEKENREMERIIIANLKPFKTFFSQDCRNKNIFSLRGVARGRPILIKFNTLHEKILKMHSDSSLIAKELKMIVTMDIREAEKMNATLEKLLEGFNWD